MKIIGTAEAARRLNVTQSRVRVLIDSGRLKAMKVGREWLIDPKDLDAVKDRKVGRPRKARKTSKTINKNLRGEAAKANKSADKR
jgi:excisionase family DNA binding protein